MGQYINPPERAREIGRRINLFSYSAYTFDFDRLSVQLKQDEVLVGLYDRGLHFVAVVLPDEKEFTEFENQYNAGGFLRREFYAVPVNGLSA